MKHNNLDKMVNGWFIGAFEPTVISTEAFEVAVKKYSAGEKESAHHHKIATEVTLILNGEVLMNGQKWIDGDIITLNPGEVTDFEALTDVVTVVVKTPSVNDDKYLDNI